MIIWSRWGFLQLLVVGLSVLTGFVIQAVTLGEVDRSGPQNGAFVGLGFVVGGVYTWLLYRYVLVTFLDKAKPVVDYIPLAQPVQNENGHTITHQPVPRIDPVTNTQFVHRPVSTFFFIPIRFWVYIMPVIGLIIIGFNLPAAMQG